MNRLKSLLKFLLAILWLPLLIWIFKDSILNFIKAHETLNAIYQFCISEIQSKTYLGAAILIFIGELFFIMFLSGYGVFVYFALTANLDPIILIAFSAGAMFCAMIVNYGFGLLIGRIFPRNYFERIENWLNSKWGPVFVFGGYLVPLFFPHGIVALAAGSSRFRFKLFVLLSAIGCVLYFIILYLIQDLVVPYVKIFFPG
jgi:membrane protein DedA with SNARE-associated domain